MATIVLNYSWFPWASITTRSLGEQRVVQSQTIHGTGPTGNGNSIQCQKFPCEGCSYIAQTSTSALSGRPPSEERGHLEEVLT